MKKCKKKKCVLKNIKKKLRGFTLVELLAVIVILAIIMIIAIPSVLDTMTVARQKSFIEYVQKVRNLGEKQYLQDQMTGTTTESSCIMYDIGKGIGLDSTGDFKGYVISVKSGNDVKYYITMWNNTYMVYGIEYTSDFSTSDLQSFTSEDDTNLSKANLAAVAGCSSYVDMTTGYSETSSGTGTSSGSGSSSSGSGSSSTSSLPTVASTVKLGDYVTYKPTSTSYTATAANTGYTSDSTINPSELTSWRVLKINDDGTLDIVSTYISSSSINFKGKTGYINFVSELQKLANSYINSTYASSARSLGFNGQTLVLTNTTALEQTTAPWTSSTRENPNEAAGGGDNLHLTDINQMKTAGILLTTTTPSGSSSYYWLASRYYTYDSSTLWSFCGRYVYTDTITGVHSLYHYSKGSLYNDNGSNAFRPVVTLKANVKVAGGTGTEENPYTLSV